MAKPQVAEFETKLSFQFLKIILYAVLLMPLWFWSVFLFPFITTKILYFRLLVELAFFVYLILALRYPELRPRWNWLVGSVWLYFLVIFTASIFGLNFYRSFWGTVERGEGLLTILHFVIYFTILPQVFRTQKSWYGYLFFAVTITLVNAFYGLGQILGVEFLTNTTGTRIAGTIGNPAFFAAYLLFGIFLSLYLLRETLTSGKRWYLRIVFWFELYTLYKTATRGALLALIFAGLLYLVFSIFRKHNQLKVKVFAATLLVLFLGFGALVYLNRQASWISASEGLGRLTTISLTDITTQSRFDTAKASWQGFKDRPILGYGYENYNLAFNKYFPARIFKDAGSQIWFDRAHNLIFDILITSGILGTLAYFMILAMAGYHLLKLYRKFSSEPGAEKYIFLFLGLLAYFVQNMAVFDTQATYLMFFLTLGFLASLYEREFRAELKTVPGVRFRPGWSATSGLALVIFVAAYFTNLKPAFANITTTDAIKAAKVQKYREVKPLFEKALSYKTYMDEEIRQRMVDNALEAVNSGKLSSDEQIDFMRYVLDELRKNLKDSPQDVRNHLYLLSVMNRSQGYFPETADEAIALAEAALKLSPTRPQTYFELGQAYFFKKNYENGLKAFRRAIELNPEPKESHLNYLLAAIISGRQEIEAEQYQLLQSAKYRLTINDHLLLARAYTIAGNQGGAVQSYQRAIDLDPQNFDLHAKLAGVYGEMCDLEKARAEIEKTMELNQAYILQGREFLRQLEEKCKK